MAPWLMIFKDTAHPEDAMYNNFRVFGTGLLCIMGREGTINIIEICEYNSKFNTETRHYRVHWSEIC